MLHLKWAQVDNQEGLFLVCPIQAQVFGPQQLIDNTTDPPLQFKIFKSTPLSWNICITRIESVF